MATYTPNYNLIKPDENDFYNIADFNANADKIDAAVNGLAQTIFSTPFQNNSLTYTGGAQSPAWAGYDTDKLTLGGTTSGTNAGNYTATFTPRAGFKWFDGTTAAKSVTWHIAKAAGSLSLDKTSMTLTDAASGTIAVTRAGNGAVSAESSNPVVATVGVSGTTVTVTKKGAGTAIITVAVAEGTNHTSPHSKTCGVEIPLPFSAASWAQIAAAVESGTIPAGWKIGDTKDIALTTGEVLTLQIYGFRHDDLVGGGKAGITLGMKNLMAATRRMEATNTNVNSFTGSEMYGWLRDTLLPSLPADLQAVIKTVNKKTSAGNQSTTIKTEAMKLFLFSAIENGLRTTDAAYKDEGSQYPIFTDATSRIKYLSNGAGSANVWWERSPYATNATFFCIVGNDGNAGGNNASVAYGVCFGFCI